MSYEDYTQSDQIDKTVVDATDLFAGRAERAAEAPVSDVLTPITDIRTAMLPYEIDGLEEEQFLAQEQVQRSIAERVIGAVARVFEPAALVYMAGKGTARAEDQDPDPPVLPPSA